MFLQERCTKKKECSKIVDEVRHTHKKKEKGEMKMKMKIRNIAFRATSIR